MNRSYIEFSSINSNPVLDKTLTITHIHAEPYSFVKKVLENSTIPSNLSSVP